MGIVDLLDSLQQGPDICHFLNEEGSGGQCRDSHERDDALAAQFKIALGKAQLKLAM